MPKVKHKHAATIKEWVDGARIEVFSKRYKRWMETKNPTWAEDTEYRVRRAVIFEEYEVIFDNSSQQIMLRKADNPNIRFCFTADGELISVAKLEGK